MERLALFGTPQHSGTKVKRRQARPRVEMSKPDPTVELGFEVVLADISPLVLACQVALGSCAQFNKNCAPDKFKSLCSVPNLRGWLERLAPASRVSWEVCCSQSRWRRALHPFDPREHRVVRKARLQGVISKPALAQKSWKFPSAPLSCRKRNKRLRVAANGPAIITKPDGGTNVRAELHTNDFVIGGRIIAANRANVVSSCHSENLLRGSRLSAIAGIKCAEPFGGMRSEVFHVL